MGAGSSAATTIDVVPGGACRVRIVERRRETPATDVRGIYAVLEPLADHLKWDVKSLECCAAVSKAWAAVFGPASATFSERLQQRWTEHNRGS